MTENKFPTEIIDLPSKGHFYPEDNPLSSGKIELRYMTARDEDILTSVNLIQQGKALDKLIQELIVDKNIDYNDLLVGDKNAILVGARILAYGKDYSFSFIDSYAQVVKGKADLTKLVPKEYDFSKYEKGINAFTYTLPKTERILTFSIPTHKDELIVEQEVEAIKKVFKDDTEAINRENSTRLKYLIKSVDGKTDRGVINNFVDNEFLSVEATEFRKFVASTSPDLSFRIENENSRGETEEVAVSMTAEFFWPNSRI